MCSTSIQWPLFHPTNFGNCPVALMSLNRPSVIQSNGGSSRLRRIWRPRKRGGVGGGKGTEPSERGAAKIIRFGHPPFGDNRSEFVPKPHEIRVKKRTKTTTRSMDC